MRCHEVDHKIIGTDVQAVEIELDPGEKVIAEAGAMIAMDDGISFTTRMGDGSAANSGIMNAMMGIGKRMLTGESVFLTHFENVGTGKKRVTFAAPTPGQIVDLNMAYLGNDILCQKDAFLAAAFGTEVSMAFNRRLGAGFFGGEGFIMQRLVGDGMAYLQAGGTLIKRNLKEGEKISIDTGCLVAMTSNIDYSIEMAPGLKTMLFGGEGLFLATLRGPGTVWIQSMPFSKLAERIAAAGPRKK